MYDDGTYDGPAILEGLRRSRDAYDRGEVDRSLGIVDGLRREHGDPPVDAIIGAVRLGFVSLDPHEDD